MSSTAVVLILMFVVVVLLRALGRMTALVASVTVTLMKGLFAAVGAAVAAVAALVLLGGVAVVGGDVFPFAGPAQHPELAVTPDIVPDVGSGVNLLHPLDPDDPSPGAG